MKISVIMGIYNCQDTLKEAVNCILAQTYTDWELIMCDDGSTDNTYEIAERIRQEHPEKIKLIRNDVNLGLNQTLNNCLALAAGEYIARMDADDLCSPERFMEEVRILETEPDISIVSTDMDLFDESGVWGKIRHPEYPQKCDFVSKSPFCHAPCMVKKTAYDTVGGYSVAKQLLRVEDYHLWVKMYAAGFKGKNIGIPLYQMRDDRTAQKRRKFKYRINGAYVVILAVNKFKLPAFNYIYALKPIIAGLLPGFVYNYLHKKRLSK